MSDGSPDTPAAEATGQTPGAAAPIAVAITEPTPASGRRQALRDLRRQLSDEDLASSGAQKLLLDALERADGECEEMKSYVTRFHEADKRAAVLQERLHTQTAMEVMFGVGVGAGSAMVGLAPVFWNTPPRGQLVLGVGLVLLIGATVGRVIKR
jgi:hypothetical protein